MVRYTSLEQAMLAHENWLYEQGISKTEAYSILDKLKDMLVGFERPDDKTVPGKIDQLYYDCWGDKLYSYVEWTLGQQMTSSYLSGGFEKRRGWAPASQHVATVAELPVCQFYWVLARADEPNVLTYAGQAYKGYVLRSLAEGARVTIPLSTPSQEMSKWFQTCEIRRMSDNKLLAALEYESGNWVDEVKLEYDKKFVFFHPSPGNVLRWDV